MTSMTVLVLLAWGAPGGQAGDEAVKQEWERLEGTWTLVTMEVDGKSLLKKDEPPARVVIKGGKVTSDRKGPGAREDDLDASKVKLDPTRKPKTITLPNFEGGDPAKGVTAIGIYERKGDELRVCVQAVETARLKEREKERPRAFDSKQGLLLVFKRQGK